MNNSEFFPKDILICDESKTWETSLWQPEFLNDDKFLGKEYKHEWRCYLATKNQEQISDSIIVKKRTLRFSFFTKAIIKKVFEFCKILKQPPEVRYLAMDITDRLILQLIFDYFSLIGAFKQKILLLNRFMISEFLNVAQAVVENGSFTQNTWSVITKRMVNRSLLRVLSSILLASKYCCNIRAITVAEIEKKFASLGWPFVFSKNDLRKSEIKMYKAINFKIPNVTPLTFVEMFLENFRNEEMKEHLHLTLSSFLNICVDVLDIALIFHKKIFQTLYSKITEKPYLTLKDPQFLSLEADYMYLAASVIYAAAVLQDPSLVVPRELLRFFSSLTEYKQKEIEMLGEVILEIIINS